MRFILPGNVPPALELDPLAVVILDGQRVYRAKWRGSDADGRVVRYRFALDPELPESPDATWQSTSEGEHLIFVPPGSGPETHVFAVVAEDDRGALSRVQTVAFTRDNVAPHVVLTTPPPTGRPPTLAFAVLPPRARIAWRGTDADGGEGARLASYRYRLFPSTSPEYRLAFTRPDSIRALHAPAFFGWHSAPGESSGAVIELSSSGHYLLAVTGFDAYGDFDPVFSLDKNLSNVVGMEPDLLPPVLTLGLFGSSITSFRLWPTDTDSTPPRFEVPGGFSTTLRWSSRPADGTEPVRHRWGWDRGAGDTTWSAWGFATETQVVFSPELGTRPRFIVQAQAELGGASAVVVEFEIVSSALDRELLVVMDTRLKVDSRAPGATCVDPPSGPWPTAAELDTFLFARGGVPWRCREAGAVTAPGLFSGYTFDTIGTRARGLAGISLSALSRYRNVVWIVDANAAFYFGAIDDPVRPTSLLRHMSRDGVVNTLASYAAMGGNVWLLGGAAGEAATIAWNRSNNDVPTRRYVQGIELVPGRLMYDFAGWRSGFRVGSAVSATQVLGRRRDDPSFAGLPASLLLRTATSDPLPGRSSQYPTRFASEFLELPNAIEHEGTSVLDSLYAVTLVHPPPGAPPLVAMTIHRRPEGGIFVFSGFDLWSFRRGDALALVDFVLGRVWGLARRPAS